MNIKITARKFKARESLKDFIKEEITNLQKFNDDIIDVDVILSYQNQFKSVKNVEIVLKVPGHTLAVNESSDEFTKAVSLAVDKLERQLKKIKTRQIEHL